MAERQPFRFRLPWLSAPAPRPTAVESEPRSVDETPQVPTRPAPTVAVQRPPFRPAGIAPVLPPPPRNGPQPQALPLRTVAESQVASQPASPSRLATERLQSRAPSSPSKLPSVPPSPSRIAPQPPASPLRTVAESQVASQPASPSRLATERAPSRSPSSPSKLPSVPPSPSRIATQTESPLKPALQPPSPPQSPSRPERQTSPPPSRVQPTTEVISHHVPPSSNVSDSTSEPPSSPPRISTQPESMTSQQEPAFPPLVAQESQSKTETISETDSKSQNPFPVETITRSNEIMIQHSDGHTPTNNFEETKEVPKLLQEQQMGNEHHSLPEPNTFTEISTVLPSSETQSMEKLNSAVKKQEQNQQEILEKKETSTTPNSNGVLFKTGNPTHKNDKNHQPGEDISKFVNKLSTAHLNHARNDKPITVITLSGENRGASMQLGTKHTGKEKPVHIQRRYKSNPDESVEDTEETSEGRSKHAQTKEDEATNAYINSNVQSINNSIVFDSSISEGSPGVQFDLTPNPIQPITSNKNPQLLSTHKDEFNITGAEKLTYRPTVRRRCLRGLMMESSDSDPDNPDKPRRHGCRYG